MKIFTFFGLLSLFACSCATTPKTPVGTLVRSEPGNAKFIIPVGWTLESQKKSKSGLQLNLQNPKTKELIFFIAASGPGKSLEDFLAFFKTESEGAVAVEGSPFVVGGMKGQVLLIHHPKRPGKARLWFAQKNGFSYAILYVAPSASTDESVEESAHRVFARFSMIDEARQSTNGRAISTPIRFKDSDSGLEFAFDSTSLLRMDNRSNDMHLMYLFAQMPTGKTVVGVSSVGLQAPLTSRPALFAAAISTLGWEYDDSVIVENVAERKGVLRAQLRMSKQLELGAYHYRFDITADKQGIVTVVGFGTEGVAAIDAAMKPFEDGVMRSPNWSYNYSKLSQAGQKAQSAMLVAAANQAFSSEDYKDAVALYSQAHDENPGSIKILSSLFSTHAYNNQASEILRVFEGCEPTMKKDLSLLSWKAWALKETGQKTEALAAYETVFEKGHKDDSDAADYFELIALQRSLAQAQEAYRKYASKGQSAKLLSDWLERLHEMERHEAIVSLILREQTSPPNTDLIERHLGALYRLDRFQEVIELAGTLDRGVCSVNTYIWEGSALEAVGKANEARSSYQSALKLNPKHEYANELFQDVSASLGRDISTGFRQPIAPVQLSAFLRKKMKKAASTRQFDGESSAFTHAITGIDYTRKRKVVTRYQDVKVFDQSGVARWSTLQHQFDPTYEKVFVNALIVKNEKGKTVAKASADTFYIRDASDDNSADNDKVLHMPVPRLEPGFRVSLTLTVESTFNDQGTDFQKKYLSNTLRQNLSSIFVKGNKYKLASRGNVQTKVQGQTHYFWAVDLPAFRSEYWAPEVSEYTPMVYLGPKSETWKSVAERYSKRIKEKLIVDESVKKLASQLVRRSKSDEDKIVILTKYVREKTNYIAIEFGARGVIPNTAAKTIELGYGDCKDQATLLHALLKSVGVESRLALVNNQSRKLMSNFPSLDQFNHAVVYIPRSGQFIDTTDKEAAATERIPSGLSNTSALILGPNKLVTVPSYRESEGIVISIVRKNVQGGKLQTIVEQAEATGVAAKYLRRLLKQKDEDRLKLLKAVLARRLGDFEIASVKVKSVFENEVPLGVELTYRQKASSREKKPSELVYPLSWEFYFLEFPAVERRVAGVASFVPYKVSTAVERKTAANAKHKGNVKVMDLAWSGIVDNGMQTSVISLGAQEASPSDYRKVRKQIERAQEFLQTSSP